MSQEARSISKNIRTSLKAVLTLVFVTSACMQMGCATATEKAERRLKVGEPVSAAFYSPYQEVETAIKQAMIKYPQRIDNTEAGLFETDYVKGESRFKAAHDSKELSNGYRYRILIRLVRGKKESKPAVRVLVTKQIQLVRDFFADPDSLTSDGLEEEMILYRIGRELSIARALARSTIKEQKQQGEQIDQ